VGVTAAVIGLLWAGGCGRDRREQRRLEWSAVACAAVKVAPIGGSKRGLHAAVMAGCLICAQPFCPGRPIVADPSGKQGRSQRGQATGGAGSAKKPASSIAAATGFHFVVSVHRPESSISLPAWVQGEPPDLGRRALEGTAAHRAFNLRRPFAIRGCAPRPVPWRRDSKWVAAARTSGHPAMAISPRTWEICSSLPGNHALQLEGQKIPSRPLQ